MNALRCRPGDLAVIVNAGDVPEMLGRYVVVHRRATPYISPRSSAYSTGAVWECEAAGETPAVGFPCDGDPWAGPCAGGQIDIPDAWLRPIRDSDPAADESTTEQRTLQLA